MPPNAIRMPPAACRISVLVTSTFEKPLVPPTSMQALPGPPQPSNVDRSMATLPLLVTLTPLVLNSANR